METKHEASAQLGHDTLEGKEAEMIQNVLLFIVAGVMIWFGLDRLPDMMADIIVGSAFVIVGSILSGKALSVIEERIRE